MTPLDPHACDVCGTRIQRFTSLDDGRVLCGGCHATGVGSESEMEALRAQVFSVLQRHSLRPQRPAALRIVDAREMAGLTGLAWKPTPGKDARSLGSYRPGENEGISNVRGPAGPDGPTDRSRVECTLYGSRYSNASE